MYEWRKMTFEQRERVLQGRRERKFPDHSPPHFDLDVPRLVHLTAACFEHRPILGFSPERMAAFEEALTGVLAAEGRMLMAWCVLPNHWHALVRTDDVKSAVRALGQLHGRSSHAWNEEEKCRGRKGWFRCADRMMRSEGHVFATINYIHHNPVHHGYVERWREWPYSSAAGYVDAVGRAEAERRWKEYPVLDYGKGWDEAEM
jgi:putative transposase